MFNKPLLALSITAAITSTAIAQEEFRQHEAHVHGHVELNIAQDGHELLMEITAPGADVVGFEHAPENDEQANVLNKALETLNHADTLFTLTSAATCQVEQAFVKHTLGGEHDEHDHAEHDHHDDHEDHNHDEHEHEHEHHDDHGEHEGHDHGEHEDHDHNAHGSFTAQYTFHCDDISKLNSIDTHWFTQFPATKEIDVNLLTDKVQTALELNPSKTKISL